jgi:hypothetical protein
VACGKTSSVFRTVAVAYQGFVVSMHCCAWIAAGRLQPICGCAASTPGQLLVCRFKMTWIMAHGPCSDFITTLSLQDGSMFKAQVDFLPYFYLHIKAGCCLILCRQLQGWPACRLHSGCNRSAKTVAAAPSFCSAFQLCRPASLR